MTTERRNKLRYPVDLGVQIRYRKRRFYGARARNVSAAGMFLELKSLMLPTGTLIELEIEESTADFVEFILTHH